MELCTVQAISKVPHSHRLSISNPSLSHFLFPKSPHGLRQSSITCRAALLYRSIYVSNLITRATISNETSSETNQYIDKERDGVINLEDVEMNDKNAFKEAVATEEIQEQVPVDQQGQAFDFLDNFDMKLDTDDTGSILLLGSGAILAFWLASAVVVAIDSIPLFPKLMEVVGLAYTLWFSSRYLLFKKNRDELAAKIQELKQQVMGSSDD